MRAGKYEIAVPNLATVAIPFKSSLPTPPPRPLPTKGIAGGLDQRGSTVHVHRLVRRSARQIGDAPRKALSRSRARTWGSCQNKVAIWGVEAPAWQGARKANSRSI